jgi:hypothetical protein
MNSLDQHRVSRPRRHRLPTLCLAIFASLSVVAGSVSAEGNAAFYKTLRGAYCDTP